jgi:pimeloyl-ACP methyl ester carboxylesterase
MPSVAVNGVDLHYEIWGEGPPLLLIAGLASDGMSWGPVIGDLSKRFRLIAPDNRGSGRTTLKGAPVSIRAMAEDCAALLAHLDVRRAAILGHSLGGAVAAELAVRRPELCGRLILAASAARMSARNRALMQDFARLRKSGVSEALFYRLFFHWLFRDEFFENPATVDEAAALAATYPFRQSAEDFERQVKAALDAGPPDGLERLKSPLLILVGGKDRLILDDDWAAYRALAGARVKRLQNAAHSLHWDDPKGFLAAAEAFLCEGRP